MKKDNYYAICIGINEYAEKNIRSLRYAEKDCRNLAATLTDDRIGLFHKDKVKLILGENAKRGYIYRVLKEEVLNCQNTDTVLIYFSGHTYQKGNEFYFLPYNATKKEFEDDPDAYMSLRAMRNEIFQDSRAQHLVVILDTCFSGSIFLKDAFTPSPNDIIDIIKTEVSSSENVEICSRSFLVSSSSAEPSLEDEKLENGVFTYNLLQGLREGAMNHETGEVTVGSLFEYVKNHMKDQRPGIFTVSFENLALTKPGKGHIPQEFFKSFEQTEIAKISSYPEAIPFTNFLEQYKKFIDDFICYLRDYSIPVAEEKTLQAILTLTKADSVFLISKKPGKWEIHAEQHAEGAPISQIVETVIPNILATISTITDHGKSGANNLQKNIFGINTSGIYSAISPSKSAAAISLSKGEPHDILIIYGDQESLSQFQYDYFAEIIEGIFIGLKEYPGAHPESIEASLLDHLRTSYRFLPRSFYERRFDIFNARLQKMSMRFQPIINIEKQEAYIDGFEALASDPSNNKTPLDLLKAAELWGPKFKVELDSYFLSKAITSYQAKLKATPGRRRPEDVLDFSINVYPESLIRTHYF